MSFTRPFLLCPVFFWTAPCAGCYHQERGGMPLSSIWAKVCMLDNCVYYLTWHDYSSLVEGESHGILYYYLLSVYRNRYWGAVVFGLIGGRSLPLSLALSASFNNNDNNNNQCLFFSPYYHVIYNYLFLVLRIDNKTESEVKIRRKLKHKRWIWVIVKKLKLDIYLHLNK